MASEGGKSSRRSVTSDKVAEGLPLGRSGEGSAKSGGGQPAAARMLLPALKEVVAGLASQYELMKEVVAAVQVRFWVPAQCVQWHTLYLVSHTLCLGCACVFLQSPQAMPTYNPYSACMAYGVSGCALCAGLAAQSC